MLDQVNLFFGIRGDYDLDLMSQDQTLFDVTERCLKGLEGILDHAKPDLVFVQGDTTTAMAGALASFYKRIPVAHLEAGLRSGDKYSPYPEEINRRLISQIADYHFAPTNGDALNLRNENITRNVYVVGNTVIDALFLGLAIINEHEDSKIRNQLSSIDLTKKIILVTGHRRESFGEGFNHICQALKQIAESHTDVQIVYPVHLNPNVLQPVYKSLAGVPNILLLEPLDYPSFIWLMEKCYLVLTDSGGVQEEAPSLGKPVLVMRDITERTDGIRAGTARLVGTAEESIVTNIEVLLADKEEYELMAHSVNPYGDGQASLRVAQITQQLDIRI